MVRVTVYETLQYFKRDIPPHQSMQLLSPSLTQVPVLPLGTLTAVKLVSVLATQLTASVMRPVMTEEIAAMTLLLPV